MISIKEFRFHVLVILIILTLFFLLLKLLTVKKPEAYYGKSVTEALGIKNEDSLIQKQKESKQEEAPEIKKRIYYPKISKRKEMARKEDIPVNEKEIKKEVVIDTEGEKFSLFITKENKILQSKNLPQKTKIEEIEYYHWYNLDFRRLYIGISVSSIKNYEEEKPINMAFSLSYTPVGLFNDKLRLGCLLNTRPFVLGFGANWVPLEIYENLDKRISSLALGLYYVPIEGDLRFRYLIFLGLETKL